MSVQRKKALVVDDNESNLILERDLLDVAGFEVFEARDAASGIAMASKELPDVIVMDVRLPDMLGYEAAELIRRKKETYRTPIVFVTASVRTDGMSETKFIPNTGFIGKPINTRTFAAEISEIILKYQPVVLVVDDRIQNAELLEAQLAPAGFSVIMVSNGQAALERIASQRVDLILLDVMMPDMNGFEVARRIRHGSENREVPIVLVTALHEPADRVKGIEAGCDGFISKPVDKLELLARVQNLLKVSACNDVMADYRHELETVVSAMTGKLELALENNVRGSLETIYRLSMAAECRDNDSGVHIKRVSHYSTAIARQMGLDKSVVEAIMYAAPLHDLGNIGIPDRILLKPGVLDAEELEIMKRHTIIGAKILRASGTDFIIMAESIALTHHEKWDGSGYPMGIKGVQIPIASRITAVADVFDALSTKRPYKEAFSVDESVAIIREGRGTHFDPAVVDAFLAIMDEILAIKDQYR